MTPQERADLARRLRELDVPDWREFIQMWIAFNAAYNGEKGAGERDRLMNAVRFRIPQRDAARILDETQDAASLFSKLPPGNMRRGPAHSKFRTRSTADLAVVNSENADSLDRLAHLTSVVYQIRCNLIHGSKDPDNQRDRLLVSASRNILARILMVLLPSLDGAPPGQV